MKENADLQKKKAISNAEYLPFLFCSLLIFIKTLLQVLENC